MDSASGEAIGVLGFLLPGFVAAAIFHAFTSHPKPSPFERLILALMFTAIAQTLVAPLPSSIRPVEIEIGGGVAWDPIWAMAFAVIVAFVVVVAVNYDLLHMALRAVRITKETAYPSPWYSSFFRNTDRYVVLHLTEERRLFGWPEEWSNDPANGHIRLIEAEWLGQGPREPTEAEILVNVEDVRMVEFVQGEESGSKS